MSPIEDGFLPRGIGLAAIFIIALAFVAALLLNAYVCSKLLNLFRALIATRCFTAKPIEGGTIKEGEEPVVTIQISCYNEATVIVETINAACMVDWPKDKLFVQILDDSTDETRNIIDDVCANWREIGVNCEALRRTERIGYKAGCLKYFTPMIKGEFVAMFDADHRCHEQFLRRSMKQFYDNDGKSLDNVGCVQAPWGYYNIHHNLLTEYDSLNLDFSHVIEQTGRGAALGCFSFNGTGGVWRTAAVEAGGGWSWDTVTEDLDLSYKAFLAGYRFVYLRDIPQQLEVPTGIRAHVQQKHRWTKGFAQVTRKSLWNILKGPKVPFMVKFEAFFHMTGSFAYLLTMFHVAIVPWLAYYELFTIGFTIFGYMSTVLIMLLSAVTIFGKHTDGNNTYKTFRQRCWRLVYAPVVVILGLGMMVFESYATLIGLFSNDATFLRTPKEGKTLDAGDVPAVVTTKQYDIDSDSTSEDETTGYESSSEDSLTTKSRRVCCMRKKPSRFVTDLSLGLFGFIFAMYLTAMAGFIVHLGKIRGLEGESTGAYYWLGVVMVLPASGLYYIHGWFLFALIRDRLRSRKSDDVKSEKQSPIPSTVDDTCRDMTEFDESNPLGDDLILEV